MTDFLHHRPRCPVSPGVHGGPDALGAALHDFSTNGNACGPCAFVVEALRSVEATHYPDPAYTALRAGLAAFHGVAPDRIFVAASASEFIFRITAAVARSGGRSVMLPRHSYGDYEKAASGWGLAIRRAVSDSLADSASPPETDADDASLVWLCDPTSPLGQAIPGIGDTIDRLPAHTTCVLDLAYEPLRLKGSLQLDLRQRDRVWQLWTPNKALGLTGIRAAYAIAPRATASVEAHVGALAPSWPVGAHGVALLAHWTRTDTQDWLADSLDVLRDWKASQISRLDSLGWIGPPSVANFFCVRPLHVSSVDGLAMRLRQRSIKVRDASSFGLPDHLRLAVLRPDSQVALLTALAAGAATG